ncbi:NADH-quinone oxidoreductase subunit M [bacterium BMS3Abin02]|nr:NADH-quinone oxidoreductase subunit M [bacterium BMS3Abin02]GBE22231.1 NADH-quinone oxidoreductase subunit M [bacterium BMS3Bbin01]
MQSDFPILTVLILLPFAAAIVVALLPSRRKELFLPVGFALSILPLALAGYLFYVFKTGEAGFQFVENVSWYAPWGISWHMGVDGISLLMVILTAILMPISLAASTSISKRMKQFVVFNLLLEGGLMGVFLSLDMFMFFVFFEVILVPMYFIIGVWGSERRIYAAVKFFIFTAFGSALMLAGIIAMALMYGSQHAGRISFDYLSWLTLQMPRGTEMWLFAAFAIAFAIKVPMFPFHTWLPDAHVEAPTAGSVMLAGVLLKMGTYGFLRFNLGLFPNATLKFVPVLAVLAVIGIVYGAAVAIVQPNLKKLVAYSSVSHLGFIVLGIFALTSQGLEGGVIQMFNHGITTGALFLLVGMIYERRHTKDIADFGGLQKVMPIFAGFFLFTAFASIGLPSLNGFIGEFLILLGSFLTLKWYAIIAASGVILAAVYLLWAYERVFTGPVTKPENEKLLDLNFREIAILSTLAALMLVIGLYPKVALDKIGPSTEAVLNRIEAVTTYQAPAPGRLADVLGAIGGE